MHSNYLEYFVLRLEEKPMNTISHVLPPPQPSSAAKNPRNLSCTIQ